MHRISTLVHSLWKNIAFAAPSGLSLWGKFSAKVMYDLGHFGKAVNLARFYEAKYQQPQQRETQSSFNGFILR